MDCPRLVSTKDCNPESLRLRDAKREGCCAGARGVARYRAIEQPVSGKTTMTTDSKSPKAEFMVRSVQMEINATTKAPKLIFSPGSPMRAAFARVGEAGARG